MDQFKSLVQSTFIKYQALFVKFVVVYDCLANFWTKAYFDQIVDQLPDVDAFFVKFLIQKFLQAFVQLEWNFENFDVDFTAVVFLMFL